MLLYSKVKPSKNIKILSIKRIAFKTSQKSFLLHKNTVVDMAGKDNRKPKELQSAAFFFFFFGISPKIEKPAFSEKHVSLIAEKC